MNNATFKFFVYNDKEEPVDIDTLPIEKRNEIGKWAYQTIVKALGYSEQHKKVV